MEWKGDDTRFHQLCQLFELASSPDNNIQQQVMQTLNQFHQLQDFNLYLVTIFAKMHGQQLIVRQGAGLLLKANLGRGPAANMNLQIAEYIQLQALDAVRDPNRVIRHTAGTLITTMVEKLGVANCLSSLDKLAGFLSDGNPDTVEGCFNALNKICEDGVTTLKQYYDDNSGFTKPFIAWCTERLLPRVFEHTSPSASKEARQNAIECLNHFALNYIFTDRQYTAFLPFAEKYVDVLGALANDSDVDVLRNVCKGFVCVIENNWNCLAPEKCQVILQYMLKASQHPEYAVRLEALEVWTPCTNVQRMCQMMQPLLKQLLAVLLDNMIYSNADYMCMEQSQIDDDNAAVPDQLEDIKPRFHKEKEDEDDDEKDGQASGGAWGAEWTVRKAAASALDHCANAFRQEILEVVLPLIQQKLEHSSWEVQESGVLALGAIAMGCMESLVPFLPKVMDLLLRLVQAPKPLLRSISCWCASRYSQWICHTQNPDRENVLRSVLSALLQRVLDKNKRVQEAACSAFATLEEEARIQLLPYLPDIVRTLVRAFDYYQAKNLLILYDAVETLAQSVGPEINRPEYVQALMVPLVQKFQTVADNDRSMIALFECVSAFAQNIGDSFLPVAPQIVERCTRLILQGARAAQMYMDNPNEFEKPDREVVSASVDLLAGIVIGLRERVKEVLVHQNFLSVLPEVLKDTALNVKQSAFALMGDSAQCCIESLVPFLPQLLPLCASSLRNYSSATVCNNASWAIGEVCVKVGPEFMTPYLDDIVPSLVGVLVRHGNQNRLLPQNICITLGRLGVVCGPQMAKCFGGFARIWCIVMRDVRNDHEKVTAFQGLCNMVKANPQACLECVPELAFAIGSLFPPPQHLVPVFREILHSYKQNLGPNWPTVLGHIPEHIRLRLIQQYELGQ